MNIIVAESPNWPKERVEGFMQFAHDLFLSHGIALDFDLVIPESRLEKDIYVIEDEKGNVVGGTILTELTEFLKPREAVVLFVDNILVTIQDHRGVPVGMPFFVAGTTLTPGKHRQQQTDEPYGCVVAAPKDPDAITNTLAHELAHLIGLGSKALKDLCIKPPCKPGDKKLNNLMCSAKWSPCSPRGDELEKKQVNALLRGTKFFD